MRLMIHHHRRQSSAEILIPM